ncbi:hypothetical protein ACFX15_009405 [Malus domestica]
MGLTQTEEMIGSVPDHLTLRHLRREIGESLEVTCVSTNNVRVTGGVEFEVYKNNDMVLLCGSLERMEDESGLGIREERSRRLGLGIRGRGIGRGTQGDGVEGESENPRVRSEDASGTRDSGKVG